MAINLESYVRVKNGSNRTINGRYDGEDYVFPAGKSTDVPIAAAAHILGFGKDEEYKANVFARLGWAVNSEQIGEAKSLLSKITFDDVPSIPGDGEDIEETPTMLEALPQRQRSVTSAPSSLPMGDAGRSGESSLRTSHVGSEDDGTV